MGAESEGKEQGWVGGARDIRERGYKEWIAWWEVRGLKTSKERMRSGREQGWMKRSEDQITDGKGSTEGGEKLKK